MTNQMDRVYTPDLVIEKTIMTARLFDGFWDRWISHGLDQVELFAIKDSLKDVHDWEECFSQYAKTHSEKAEEFKQKGLRSEAEDLYRKSALYYNLIQWIYPDCTKEKVKWYLKSNNLVAKADRLSEIRCVAESIEIDGLNCFGRIRIPEKARGCVIIINPIDSSKEELYTYEKQFIDSEFITVSFDGPGQGETFIKNGLKATSKRWERFIDKVIDFTADKYPSQSIYLFGTSSGAAWSIHSSANSKVEKVVAVSPPIEDGSTLPNYFGDRLTFISEQDESVVPDLSETINCKSVLLFHGNKDVMVNNQDLHLFFESLPLPKDIVEYPDEGHCCNFKLKEVRDLSMKWFRSKGDQTQWN